MMMILYMNIITYNVHCAAMIKIDNASSSMALLCDNVCFIYVMILTMTALKINMITMICDVNMYRDQGFCCDYSE